MFVYEGVVRGRDRREPASSEGRAELLREGPQRKNEATANGSASAPPKSTLRVAALVPDVALADALVEDAEPLPLAPPVGLGAADEDVVAFVPFRRMALRCCGR